MNESVIQIIYPYVPLTLAMAAVGWKVLRIERRPFLPKMILLFGCLLIPIIPIGELNAAEYLLSVIGHLSVTTTIMLAALLYRQMAGRSLLVKGELHFVAALIFFFSVPLYASAFGLVGLNIFDLGFGSAALFALLLALNITLFVCGRYFAGCLISLAVVAYSVDLMGSLNFWDYFTDPSITIFSFIWFAYALTKWAKGRVAGSAVQHP